VYIYRPERNWEPNITVRQCPSYGLRFQA